MKTKLPYSACKETAYVWLALTLMLIIAGCSAKEQEHSNHQVTSSNNLHNHQQHDSMSAKTDTSFNETYWSTLPTNKTVIAKQQAIQPEFSDMNFSISGNGYIAFDVSRNRKVPVRVGGRIERLFVKYNYQYVRKGEKILDLYSPELNTYVEEYLYVKRQANDSVLLNSSRQKLLLLGLTASQLKEIDESGRTSFTIPFYSPFEGYVLFNPSGPSAAGMENAANTGDEMSSDMNSALPSSSSGAGTAFPDYSIREGMYVSKNQTLFWINDFQEAWGIIAFTKGNEKYISKGQPVIIRSELEPEKPIQASVQLIEQVYQGGQKFTQARVHLPNNGGILKLNSLITATVTIPAKSLMLPAGSVYYLGKIAIVWVRTGVTKEGNNIFQSRVVRTGHQSKDKVEILDGLKENEFVARDAGYLADSETIISY